MVAPDDISAPDPVSALRPALMRQARKLCAREDLAQDLTQDVLLRLWAQLRHTECRNPTAQTANRTLRRLWLCERLKSRGRVGWHDDMAGALPDAFAHHALRELESVISRLPQEQAILIHLVAMGETSPAALARHLHLPEGTVMSRLARARARLRAELGIGAQSAVSALI